MYRFDAEDPGQSLYTPTTVGVIYLSLMSYMMSLCSIFYNIVACLCIYSCSIGVFVICPDDGNRMVTETLANIF